MRRIIKFSLIFLLVVVLLVVGLIGTVISTPGLHFVINSAARWVPGLDIAGVTGGWRNLTLTGVSYQMPGVKVKAGEFHLAVDVGCLKKSELCLNALTANQIDVAINTQELAPSEPAPEETNSEPLTELKAPYPVAIRLLRINNVHVTVDDTAISLDEFRTGAEWRDRGLTLLPTRIQSLLVALPKTPATPVQDQVVAVAIKDKPVTQAAMDAASESAKQAASDAAEHVAKQVVKPEQAKADAQKEVQAEAEKAAPEKPLGEVLSELFAKPLLPDLPALRLPLDLTVKRISGDQLRVTGDSDIVVNTLLVRAVTKDSALRLHTLEVRSPQGNVSMHGQATLSDQWPMDFRLNADLNVDPVKGEKLKLGIKGNLRDVLTLDANLSGPLKATLAAETQLAKAGLPLALTLESPGVQWPLTGASEYQAKNIRVRLNGSGKAYALSMRTDVSGNEIPAAKITLDGKGTDQQFNLNRLRVAALQGNTDLSALVDWSKAISWKSKLTLDGINTAKQWPEWPAKLNGKIETQGSLYGGNWQLRVPVLQLAGNVKQNQVDVRGNLTGNQAGQWKIPEMHIGLGRNKIDITGELSDKWALDAVIDAPRLDGNLPGLAGTAKGTLKLRGNLKAPQVLADLTASGLQWQTLTINRIKLDGDVRSAEQIEGNLNVRVEQLKQDDFLISLLTLDAKGSEKQHQLQLKINGDPISGQLALKGSFDRATERWQGTLNDTRFDTPVGEWRLTRPIALDYLNAQQKISVGPHCWLNPNAEVCVPKTIEAGASGNASVVLNRFDLAMIKPFLGPDTALNGVFTGRADVSWKEGEALPEAKVTLSGKGVKVQQVVQGNPLPIAFDTLNLNAALNHGRAQLDWLIKIAGNGQLDGNVQVADPQGRRNLSGNVNIKNISLAMLNPALMSGEKAQGMLNAALRLGGNAQQPQIYGRMALDKVDIDGQFMPFDITDGNLAVNFEGMSSALQGVIKTSRGQLNLTGNADWRVIDAWRAQIAVKGDRVRVTVPPMVRLDVSPDIVFEATPKMFALNGSVAIPWARITVQELPESAVSVSSDEVMLNNDRQPIKPATASIPINSNLNISIGPNVRLDAFGLKARLQGDLKMVQDEHGLGLNGQVNIPEGRFAAYGQDLLIRKGELIFSGPPEQPLLNIEAIRNPDATEDDVTAGVRVTGLADQPKLEVFSDPAMSQQMALSYLLRGQGLESSGTDSNAMTSMLIGMGVAQSGKLVGKIGETFGVSNLSLDAQGVGDSSQVVVSGYVLPGLQVKHGVGIFDSLATLTLRYRLMPKLYLEAVSGLDQALDLLYQFEFE